MGTRSRIAVMHGDNCKSVYCHWDGYLEHNGQILLDHYDSAKANQLVALGDMSSLGQHINVPDLVEHTFEKPAEGVSVFYGRDRGEKGTDYIVHHTFNDFLEQCDSGGVEFYYIMRDGVWYVGDTYDSTRLSKKLTPLAEALADEDIESNLDNEKTALSTVIASLTVDQ